MMTRACRPAAARRRARTDREADCQPGPDLWRRRTRRRDARAYRGAGGQAGPTIARARDRAGGDAGGRRSSGPIAGDAADGRPARDAKDGGRGNSVLCHQTSSQPPSQNPRRVQFHGCSLGSLRDRALAGRVATRHAPGTRAAAPKIAHAIGRSKRGARSRVSGSRAKAAGATLPRDAERGGTVNQVLCPRKNCAHPKPTRPHATQLPRIARDMMSDH